MRGCKGTNYTTSTTGSKMFIETKKLKSLNTVEDKRNLQKSLFEDYVSFPFRTIFLTPLFSWVSITNII